MLVLGKSHNHTRQTEGRMRTFKVFAHSVERPEAVKIGFSWPAFFFGTLWMLEKGLWKFAGLWFGTYAVVDLSFALGSNVQDRASMFMLALSINVGLKAFVGANGNQWWQELLLRRRYKHIATIPAESPEAATERAPRHV